MPLHDSQNESNIAALLAKANIRFETQASMPVTDWPWKTPGSKGPPKSDFYLPDAKLHVEVKGYMTLWVLAKSAWLSQQGFNYYFLQSDDETWDPFADSPVPRVPQEAKQTKAALKRAIVAQQIAELHHLNEAGVQENACNAVSRARIRRYIQARMSTYSEWVGEFP